jgi:uncharacterized protein YkwD
MIAISVKSFFALTAIPLMLSGRAFISDRKIAETRAAGAFIIHMEEEILYYVNLDRKSKSLDALQINDTESSIALQHSKNMASGKTPFGHEGLESRAKAIRKKIGNLSTAGENVAYGHMTAKEVVDGWLNSPGHRKNIEGDFVLTGIGCATDNKGMMYYTQIFTK